MIEKWYSASSFGGTIPLGKAGEGEAVRLRIDVSEWLAEYPSAAIRLFVVPPKPLTPYFASISEPENGEIVWTVVKADTQAAGSGSLELMMMDGEDVLLKSKTAQTTILPSPSSESAAGDRPDIHPSWWEGALEKIEAARTEAVGDVKGAFNEEVAAGKAAVSSAGEAQVEAVEQKGAATLATIPEDYTALYNRVIRNTKIKADAFIETSAKAASHELYMQRESDVSVTLFGNTTRDGVGDADLTNVRPLHGIDTAVINTGSGSIAIPIKTPLYGNSDYRDTIENDVFADGKYVSRITRYWDAFVVDGNEDWEIVDEGTARPYYYYEPETKTSYKTTPTSCSHFLYNRDISSSLDGVGFRHYISNQKRRIAVRPNWKPEEFLSVEGWKAYLAEEYAVGTPMTFLLVKDKPEVVVSGPIQIVATGDNPETISGSGETEVVYAYDLKHYIDEKFDALAAALIGG